MFESNKTFITFRWEKKYRQALIVEKYILSIYIIFI